MKNNLLLLVTKHRILNAYPALFFVFILLNAHNLNAQTCLVKSFIKIYYDSADTTQYTYAKKTRLLSDLTYALDGGGGYVTESRSYENGLLSVINEGVFSHRYEYNENKQLTKINDYDDLGVTNFYQEYTFDEQNRLVKHAYYEKYNYQEYVATTFSTYRYEGDKKVIMEEYHDFHDEMKTPQYTYVTEYSDKLNPFYQPVAFPDVSQKYLAEKEVITQFD